MAGNSFLLSLSTSESELEQLLNVLVSEDGQELAVRVSSQSLERPHVLWLELPELLARLETNEDSQNSLLDGQSKLLVEVVGVGSPFCSQERALDVDGRMSSDDPSRSIAARGGGNDEGSLRVWFLLVRNRLLARSELLSQVEVGSARRLLSD